MINTRAQAEALVAACKYAPRGYRSWGPVRASIYAGADYGDHANDDLIVMPMIETAEAVKNIDRHPARARHRRGLRRPVGSLAHDGLASPGSIRPTRRSWRRS